MSERKEFRRRYIRSLVFGWIYLLVWVAALFALLFNLERLNLFVEIVWSLVLAILVPSLTDLTSLFSNYEEFVANEAQLDLKKARQPEPETKSIDKE